MALTGTIAPTDFGWYDFLRQRSSWNEVNFWTPSTHFAFRAEEFSPFLFKLKSPHNAICGFGYLARYSALPDWLAWNCFGEGNGNPSLEAMRKKIEKGNLRDRPRFSSKYRAKPRPMPQGAKGRPPVTGDEIRVTVGPKDEV